MKVFCCTLIHCFSTVNIFDQGGIQGAGPIGKDTGVRREMMRVQGGNG